MQYIFGGEEGELIRVELRLRSLNRKLFKKKICIDKTSIATLDLPANKNICCNSILAFKVARRTVNNYTPTDEEF